MIVRWFRKQLDAGLVFFVGFFLLFISFPIAGLIILYKTFLWLESGEWQAFPLANFLPDGFFNTPFGQWLNHPDSWKGLHELVIWFFTTSLEWVLIGFAFWLMCGFWLLEWFLKSMVENKSSNDELD